MNRDSATRYNRVVNSGGLGLSHRWLVDKVPPGATVLDCGCAGGYVAEALVPKGCTVDGLDIDADASRDARRHCRSLFVGSLEDPVFLAALDGPYDRILFGDVLEHLVDPGRVLEGVRHLLGPGGRVLISIPNVANWRLRWRLLLGRFEYEDVGLCDRTHLRFYTYGTARALVEDAGYGVMDQDLTTGPPPFLVGWRYLEPLLRHVLPANLIAYQSLIEAEPA
jgi:2-polyprenyl-3-methyl-5-hydroxy-6-metoxy-1,4-benzoquinol methylase